MHLEYIYICVCVCVCDWLWLIYYWSIANYKVLELKLVCSCLYFNINTNACTRNNKSYIRPIYNCHRLFLLVNVNEMILLVACSYLHVELCSFIIVVDLGEKSNKAEVFFFLEVKWILIFLFLEEKVILNLKYFLFVYVLEINHTVSSKHFMPLLPSSSHFWLP